MANDRSLQEDIAALENAFASPVVNKALEVFNAVIEGVDDNYGTTITRDGRAPREAGEAASGDLQVPTASQGNAGRNAESAGDLARIGSIHYKFGKRIAADSGY